MVFTAHKITFMKVLVDSRKVRAQLYAPQLGSYPEGDPRNIKVGVTATEFEDTVSQVNDAVSDVARSYKVYTATLTQASTAAPTATALENTIGSIVWARTGAGVYTGTLTGAFTANKTLLFAFGNAAIDSFVRTSANIVTLTTGDPAADDNLTATPIEIKVYN